MQSMKPVVLLSVVCMAAAYGGVMSPYGNLVSPYSGLVSPYSGVVAGPYLARAVYPGYSALAQAPHSPAVVLDAARAVPLDTPEVVAARAAHYQAKALSLLHHLKKRSAPLPYSSITPLAYSSPLLSAYSAPIVSAYPSPTSAYSAPLAYAYSSPLAYHGVIPKALSIRPY